jgi:hypothetical protein
MGWGEPHGEVPVTIGQDVGARLFLSLRQCATHPAGPLRAVSDLIDARLSPDELSALACDMRARVAEMDMPADRRKVAARFLDALFDGVLCSSLS